MKHLLIAVVMTIGLAFAPLAQAMCKDPDCALELVKVDKKETQSKALHVCACHHHSTNAVQFPAMQITATLVEQSAAIVTLICHMTSATISPLLEPPSHA